MANGRGRGRPKTGRDGDIKIPVKPSLKAEFVAYCKARNIKPVDLFEQWVTRELANPSQPELAPKTAAA